MGSMKEPTERLVPTPEELERGSLERRENRAGGREETRSEEERGWRRLFSRGRGVGRRRKYVKVARTSRTTSVVEEPPPPGASRLPEPAEKSGSAATAQKTESLPDPTPHADTLPAKPAADPVPEVSARRVKSVTVPSRRPSAPPKPKPKPKYKPYSKEAQFFEKATSKGHDMGPLVKVPYSTNFEATCQRCQMKGELVVEIEDNYANVTNHIYRGHAINRSCRPSE